MIRLEQRWRAVTRQPGQLLGQVLYDQSTCLPGRQLIV